MTEENKKMEEKKEQTIEKATKGKVESKENKAEPKDKKPNPSEKENKEPKTEAISRGQSLHCSRKHAMYICSFIKNKTPAQAITDLESVISMRKPIPFKGEIPHRRGKIMSGRYPVKASNIFISLLKSLQGNIIVNGLDPESTVIKTASATHASRPMRRGGMQGKRTNVLLIARPIKAKSREKK
jgi:ribosomal protein L22